MTAVDPRWVVHHGVRYWEGDTFPEPADYELEQYYKPFEAPIMREACGEKRGTEAGATRHRRAGEKMCEMCETEQRYLRNRRAIARKTNTCLDCGEPISAAAKRCRQCGCGSFRAYQIKRKDAA